MRIAVIGYGAIGTFLIDQLRAEPAIEITAVFAVPAASGDVPVVSSVEELLSTRPDMVVECAGHEALKNAGERIIGAGRDLLVASVGALADSELEEGLRRAAASGGGRLIIPGGALGGLDMLSTAREGGLDSVDYVGRKAPNAWKGTYAEDLIDLKSVATITTFLECDARTAALRFPQNANVVAALALAGLGFERTTVRLVVDPTATGNHHAYVARGAFGEISASIKSVTLPSNPKTSVLAPFSLLQTIKKRAGLILA